jgi:hypothetical protein
MEGIGNWDVRMYESHWLELLNHRVIQMPKTSMQNLAGKKVGRLSDDA